MNTINNIVMVTIENDTLTNQEAFQMLDKADFKERFVETPKRILAMSGCSLREAYPATPIWQSGYDNAQGSRHRPYYFVNKADISA